ncbi:MAG: hypothetical protein LC774_09175 [Acidobacteria bacterium]|nr:hypothetical protein [Acidobacteriota bacterium]
MSADGIFARLTRGSAESAHEMIVHAKKSQSGRSIGVRRKPVRRVTTERAIQPRAATLIAIHAAAIEAGAKKQ